MSDSYNLDISSQMAQVKCSSYRLDLELDCG